MRRFKISNGSQFRWTNLPIQFFCAAITIFLLVGQLAADITIIERDSSSRLRVFTGSGGALNIDDESDSLENPTGPFTFSRSFSSMVTEDNPFSNGAAIASGTVSVSDDILQISSDSIRLNAMRSSNGTVEHISGTGNAAAWPFHSCRLRFSVTDDPVRYHLTGEFSPGPIDNGAHSLRMYRPFTANTFFEFFDATELDSTGILQPGLTYEVRVRCNDLLNAGAGSPGPTAESTFYDIEFNVATAILGDTNMDGVVNLLDVQSFIDALSTGEYLFEADVNQDDVVNLLDVEPFVAVLAG